MSTKWLVFVISLWVILGFLGGIMEQTFFPQANGGAGVINTLLGIRQHSIMTDAGWVVGAAPEGSWFDAFKTIATFDFVFLQNTAGQMIRLALFLPIGLAMAITLVLAVVRGVGSR